MTDNASVKDANWKTVQMEVLAQVEKLPSLSTVVTEFLEMARQEYVTAKDFEKVLSKDQALVARLLKIANSGMFSGSRTVDTIPEAIVLIGMDNMKKMVYAVSAEGLLRQDLKSYRFAEKGFWLHSLGVATLSRAIAEAAKNSGLKGEEAFVAGLIHDVGKLIIDDFLDTGKGRRKIDCEEEIEACGLDHSELAGHIMKVWNISDTIQKAVRFHHDPLSGDTPCPEAAVVNMADAISHTWSIGTQTLMDLGEDVSPAEYSEQMSAIELSEQQLPQVLLDVRQNLAKLQNLYDDEEE